MSRHETHQNKICPTKQGWEQWGKDILANEKQINGRDPLHETPSVQLWHKLRMDVDICLSYFSSFRFSVFGKTSLVEITNSAS